MKTVEKTKAVLIEQGNIIAHYGHTCTRDTVDL